MAYGVEFPITFDNDRYVRDEFAITDSLADVLTSYRMGCLSGPMEGFAYTVVDLCCNPATSLEDPSDEAAETMSQREMVFNSLGVVHEAFKHSGQSEESVERVLRHLTIGPVEPWMLPTNRASRSKLSIHYSAEVLDAHPELDEIAEKLVDHNVASYAASNAFSLTNLGIAFAARRIGEVSESLIRQDMRRMFSEIDVH